MTYPAQLFSGGVQGIWLKNDITTMFTDTAGTTQCTAAGDLVKCWKDQSGNGHDFTEATVPPTLRKDATSGQWYLETTGTQYLTCASFTYVNATDGGRSAGFAGQVVSTTTQYRIVDGDPNAFNNNNQRNIIQTSGATSKLECTIFQPSNSTAKVDDGSGTLSANTDFYGTGVSSNSAVECWLNGSSDGSTATTANVANGAQQIRVGARLSNASGGLNGRIYGAVVVANALNSTDRGGLETYLQTTYATLSSGFTLTAATGSFALTGPATALKAARLLSSATGAFALTGPSATLAKGFRLTASTGAFALTGPATALLVGRKLASATGAFALNGYAASLLRAAKLTAATGAFSLTGFSATLTKGSAGAYTLTASPGVFALTGIAATLKAGRLLSAQRGAYTLAGFAVGGIAARRLGAAAGAYVLFGRDATLVYSGAALPRTYPLAGTAQPYPQTAPQTYPLEGVSQQYPL